MNSSGPEAGFQVSYRKKTSKCEYDTLIDNAIIDELSTSEPLSSLELKGRVEFQYFRGASSDEKRRMLIIHGKKKAEKMMKRFNLQRNKFRSGLLKTHG